MNVSLNSDSNCTLKAVAVFRPSYHIIVSKIHLLYQAKTGRAWNTSPSKEIRESVEILFWSYSVVSFAAQANVVTHFLRSTILHCQAYEASNQIFIVIQFGSFRDFFFIIIMGQRTFVGGWEEEFSEEQNISKTRSGREMETRRALCYGKCDVSMKGLLQYMRNIAKFCGMSRF